MSSEKKTPQSADRSVEERADQVTQDENVTKKTVPRWMVWVPALIAVLGLIAAGILANRPGISYDNSAYVDDEKTAEVATVAAANVQRLMAIDYRTVDEYHDSLDEFLAPALREELEASWETMRQSYVQSETVVNVRVTDVAVTYLQDNRAETLVAAQVKLNRGEEPLSESIGTYVVGLQDMDGGWKITSIPDLAGGTG